MRALPLVLSFTLVGCASNCREFDIYRPIAKSLPGVVASVRQTEVVLDVASLAFIKSAECGWRYRNAAKDPVSICLEIKVADGEKFQFVEPVITIVVANTEPRNLVIGSIRYEIFVKYKPDGSEISSSVPQNPLFTPLQIRRGERRGDGRTDVYAFDSSAAFVGAESTSGPFVQRLISEEQRRLRYRAAVELPENIGRNFTLLLPAVRIGSVETALPAITFSYAREPVCFPSY